MHCHVLVTPKVGEKYTVILDESMILDSDMHNEAMEKLKERFPIDSKISTWFCMEENCPEYHKAESERMVNLLKGEKVSHNPNDVALVMDVVGKCRHCKKHTTARLVAYYSKEILIRCSQCKMANKFDLDSKTYTDGKAFAPFINDEDDEKNV